MPSGDVSAKISAGMLVRQKIACDNVALDICFYRVYLVKRSGRIERNYNWMKERDEEMEANDGVAIGDPINGRSPISTRDDA